MSGLRVTMARPPRLHRCTTSIRLAAVRQAALGFTALLHHITVLLEQSYCASEQDSAPGVGVKRGLVPLRLRVKLLDARPSMLFLSLYDLFRVDDLDLFAAPTTRPTSVSRAFSGTSLPSVSRSCFSR